MVEVTYKPVSAAFFQSKDDSPSSATTDSDRCHVQYQSQHVVDGGLGAMLATTSDLRFGDMDSDTKAPNILNYMANMSSRPGAVTRLFHTPPAEWEASRCSSGMSSGSQTTRRSSPAVLVATGDGSHRTSGGDSGATSICHHEVEGDALEFFGATPDARTASTAGSSSTPFAETCG
jgi:hypothetical protein